MAGWTIAAATRRGEAHARRGERAQDALRAAFAGGALVAAVADGAGSAPRGGAGAALAVRALVAAARADLARAPLAAADPAAWMGAAAARLRAAAAARGLPPRDLATTALVAASDGRLTLAAHVGDGAAALRDAAGAWSALSWPEGGAHAGETLFLTDEAPAIRSARHEGTATGLALLTDGLERLVLDFAARVPHGPFFARMAAPLADRPPGRDRALSLALADWLGGAAVAARTDDDRTLLLAALRPAAEAAGDETAAEAAA